jgi:uncharacterized repeat protein (TIGR01451 family)
VGFRHTVLGGIEVLKARISQVIAAGFSAAAVLMFSVPTPASAAVPGSAEGDSYAAYGQVEVLGSGPFLVGPIQPARASLPPGSDPQSAASGALNFVDPTNPLIHNVNVLDDNAKATLSSTPINCWRPTVTEPVVTPPFNDGPLTGGNGCSHIADVGIIPQGTPPAKVVDLVSAAVIDVQSTTQSCTATPTGAANFVDLEIEGNAINLGPVPPNTVISIPGLATIILNEQIYDNHGHGLTVNGVHVFLSSGLSALAGADVILAHAHSQAFCSDTSTTDTGKLPCLGGTPCPRPIVNKTDSTKHANPGETVVYTVNIDPNTCPVTSVTDTLPLDFHYVSSSGNLGSPLISTLPDGQTQLFWFNGGAPFANAPAETITVTIDPNAPAGQYINVITGTSDCGSFAGTDITGLFTGPPANQGGNPGIIVPRSAPPAAPQSPASGTQAAATLLPFTSTAAVDQSGPVWVGLFFLGLALTWMAGMGLVRAKQDN